MADSANVEATAILDELRSLRREVQRLIASVEALKTAGRTLKPEREQGGKPASARPRSPGRTPSPAVAQRNKRVAGMYKAGNSTKQVCKTCGIKPALARQIKSKAGLGRKRTGTETG